MDARLQTHQDASSFLDVDIATGSQEADAFATALLDALHDPALVLDASGRAIGMNAAARRLLDSGLLERRGESIVPVLSKSRHAWRVALHEALQGRPSLVDLDEQRVRCASVTRVHAPENPCLLVMVGRDVVQRPGAVRAFAALRGLTPAEADVLAHLACGLTPAEVAARHARSLNTVRTQVRSILAKLGLHGLQPLVAQVARLPALPSALTPTVDQRTRRSGAVRAERLPNRSSAGPKGEPSRRERLEEREVTRSDASPMGALAITLTPFSCSTLAPRLSSGARPRPVLRATTGPIGALPT